MNNFNRTEFTTQTFYEAQASQGYIKRQAWVNVVDETTSYIHAAINTTAVITTGITQPDFARLISITGGGADHDATGNVVITGKNIRDQIITDTIALNSNTTVAGVKAFKTITSIDATGVTGLDATANFVVGITDALGLARVLQEDSLILGTAGGVFEATRPTIVHDTDIAKNTITFNTDFDGTTDFAAFYITTEQVDSP